MMGGMRNVLRELKFMIKDLMSGGYRRTDYDDPLKKTLRDSTHTAYGNNGGSGFSNNDAALNKIADGSEQYAKSFKNRRRR